MPAMRWSIDDEAKDLEDAIWAAAEVAEGIDGAYVQVGAPLSLMRRKGPCIPCIRMLWLLVQWQVIPEHVSILRIQNGFCWWRAGLRDEGSVGEDVEPWSVTV